MGFGNFHPGRVVFHIARHDVVLPDSLVLVLAIQPENGENRVGCPATRLGNEDDDFAILAGEPVIFCGAAGHETQLQ